MKKKWLFEVLNALIYFKEQTKLLIFTLFHKMSCTLVIYQYIFISIVLMIKRKSPESSGFKMDVIYIESISFPFISLRNCCFRLNYWNKNYLAIFVEIVTYKYFTKKNPVLKNDMFFVVSVGYLPSYHVSQYFIVSKKCTYGSLEIISCPPPHHSILSKISSLACFINSLRHWKKQMDANTFYIDPFKCF